MCAISMFACASGLLPLYRNFYWVVFGLDKEKYRTSTNVSLVEENLSWSKTLRVN